MFEEVFKLFGFVDDRDREYYCTFYHPLLELEGFVYYSSMTNEDYFADFEDPDGYRSHHINTPEELYRALHNVVRNGMDINYKKQEYEGF